ncbi:hypothetical protein [Ureaplasma ceti]|uniref:Uncharacterized protein n=1 Tax=Ureaplasma ceti TaxID=3119530 RepID=A0ABP9U6P3_9BACT
MKNIINNQETNNETKKNKDKKGFVNSVNSVIGLSATAIVLEIIAIALLIYLILTSLNYNNAQQAYAIAINSANSGGPYSANDALTYKEIADSLSTIITQTWIALVVIGVIALIIKIVNAVYASKVNSWLSLRNYIPSDGKVISICAIIAIFIAPLILFSVVLGYACSLRAKIDGETWAAQFGQMNFNPYPYGPYPYYPQNNFGPMNPNNPGFNNNGNPYQPKDNNNNNNPDGWNDIR